MTPIPSLSVVLPVYNEAAGLRALITGLAAGLRALAIPFEIIVIDDASTDGSAEILRALAVDLPQLRVISHLQNSGHGPSIVEGYRVARLDWVWQLDSDGQFDPLELSRLFEKVGSHALILGVRQNRHDPLHRRLLSRLLMWGLRVRFGLSLEDANCPFRLIRVAELREWLEWLTPSTRLPNVQLTLLAAKTNQLIEVPVHHFPRVSGHSSLRWKKLLPFLWQGGLEILRFRM